MCYQHFFARDSAPGSVVSCEVGDDADGDDHGDIGDDHDGYGDVHGDGDNGNGDDDGGRDLLVRKSKYVFSVIKSVCSETKFPSE